MPQHDRARLRRRDGQNVDDMRIKPEEELNVDDFFFSVTESFGRCSSSPAHTLKQHESLQITHN